MMGGSGSMLTSKSCICFAIFYFPGPLLQIEVVLSDKSMK